MKIIIAFLIVWILILNILVIVLFRGFKADDEVWKSQLKFNKWIIERFDRQVEFNKNVQKYVIVNL